MNKTFASLSLDLDNKWSYLKTHGDPSWATFPSYLDILVPRVLEFLEKRHLTITFFIVGQDAALERNQSLLASIAAAGHEIGNHSYHHEPWLHRYSKQQIEAEIGRAETQIEQATGGKPVGFRGPGFSVSHATLEVLTRRGYLYDASTLPTFLGPLARAYYFMTARLSPEQRIERGALFGGFADGMRSIKPYRWHTDERLIEIPVTTMPFLRVPFHLSYILYASAVAGPYTALHYFRAALALCRLGGIQPSLLLHPLDFLGCDDVTGLEFFPGMRLSGARKLMLVGQALDLLLDAFRIVTLREHALHVATASDLKVIRFQPSS